MADLSGQLQETIDNLKQLRDKQNPPNQEIVAQLDTLYTQKERLIKIAIDQVTTDYMAATAAMEAATAESKKTIDSLARVEKTITMVATAIAKVATLLETIGAA